LTSACAEIITRRSNARDRLTAGLFPGLEGDPLPILEHALEMTEQIEPLLKKLHDNRVRDWRDEAANSVLSDADRALLAEADEAIHRAIMVDDFDPKELGRSRNIGRAEAAK
jgi:acyl-CoA dehydrogenase